MPKNEHDVVWNRLWKFSLKSCCHMQFPQALIACHRISHWMLQNSIITYKTQCHELDACWNNRSKWAFKRGTTVFWKAITFVSNFLAFLFFSASWLMNYWSLFFLRPLFTFWLSERRKKSFLFCCFFFEDKFCCECFFFATSIIQVGF